MLKSKKMELQHHFHVFFDFCSKIIANVRKPFYSISFTQTDNWNTYFYFISASQKTTAETFDTFSSFSRKLFLTFPVPALFRTNSAGGGRVTWRIPILRSNSKAAIIRGKCGGVRGEGWPGCCASQTLIHWGDADRHSLPYTLQPFARVTLHIHRFVHSFIYRLHYQSLFSSRRVSGEG